MRLREGLLNGSALLLEDGSEGVECSFWKEGLPSQVVVIRDEVLAISLEIGMAARVLKGSYARDNYPSK